MKPAIRFFLGLLLIAAQPLSAQLDSVHWLPPCHAAGEYGEHYLYLTTPSIEDIHISIKLGNGQFAVDAMGTVLDDVIISNTNPQRIFLGVSVQAGADIVMLTAKSELNQAISNKGLILKSSSVFYTNYRVRSGLQGASLTSKGENALGKDFRIGHIPGASDANVPTAFQRSNFIAIMATEDNTLVEITDLHPDVSFESPAGAIRSGGSVQITLDQGESYVVSAYYGTRWPTANAMGLMGAKVTSNHPVSVICGSWLGSPFNYSNQDIGIDQIVPTEYTGKEYVLVRGDGPIELETPIAIAISDGTDISINGVGPMATLDAGEYLIIDESNYTANQNIYVEGSKAFYMYQSLAGANDRRTGGLNFIPPLGCSSEKSINNIMDIDLIGSTSFQGKLFIVSEAGENVWVNGNIVPDVFLQPLTGNDDYKTFKSASLSGLVDVRSTGAIQVGIFGRNNAAGWAGYFSGFKKAVPPKVKINVSRTCDGLLFLDVKEDVKRLEWYHNNSVIDTLSDTISAKVPGEYYIIAYNQVCDALHVDTSEIVTIEPPLQFNIEKRDLPCISSTEGYIKIDSLTGGYPPYRISYDDGISFSNDTSIGAVKPGTYFIVVEDDKGCRYYDTIEIENLGLNPKVNLISPDTITCYDPIVQILTTGSDRGPDLNYSWTPNSFISNEMDTTVTTQNEGVYKLTITDLSNGCSSSDSVTIFKNKDLPDLSVLGNQVLTCSRKSITLSANSTIPPSMLKYSWKSLDGNTLNDSTSSEIITTHPGSYVVTITNKINGCQSDTLVTVSIDTTKPILAVYQPDTLTCIRTQVLLNAIILNNGSHSTMWSTNDGEILNGRLGLSPLISQPGTYILNVKDSINGCHDSIEIVVLQDTSRPVIDLGADVTLTCRDSSVLIQKINHNCDDCLEIWETISGRHIIDPHQGSQTFLDSGRYVLHSTDQSSGCIASDTINISVAPRPTNVIVTPDQGSCDQQRGSISIDSIIGGVGPYSYSINGGITYSSAPVFQDLIPGRYHVRIRDANNCFLDFHDSILIHEKIRILSIKDLNLIIGQNARFQVDINLPLDKVFQIIWSPDQDLSCNDCLNPSVLAIKNGVYKIEVEDIYGCIDVAEIRVNVLRKLDVFIPNAFTPSGDLINDGFTGFVKKGQARRIKQLQIFSRWGELMFNVEDIPVNQPEFGWDGIFNGKRADPGVYVYIMEIEFIDDTTEVYYGDVTLIR